MEKYICLTDLLDQDLSSYEYFYSLSKKLRDKIEQEDPTSFEEMQEVVENNPELKKI